MIDAYNAMLNRIDDKKENKTMKLLFEKVAYSKNQ